eukprot:403336727
MLYLLQYSQIRKEDVYEYTRIPLKKRCKRIFRQADFYANPITLRYKGEKKFYTNFGALTSTLIIAGMVALTVYYVALMLSMSQITFQVNNRLAPAQIFDLGTQFQVALSLKLASCKSCNNSKTSQIQLYKGFKQQTFSAHKMNYFDTRVYEDLMPNNLKEIDIFVMNNSASLSTDYLRIKRPQALQFYQVNSIEKYINSYDEIANDLIRINLVASVYTSIYESKIFTIFDVFAQIGGIYNSLFTLGFLFCAAFSYNLYLSSLIRKLYHFKARFFNELPKNKKDKKTKKKKQNQFSINDSRRQSDYEGDHDGENYINNQADVRDQIEREHHLGVQEIKDEIRQVIGKANKASFNYRTMSILKALACCLIFRDRKTLRKDPGKRKVLYFLKGRQRLDKEMDLGYIIHNIRKVKYLMKILLDKDQRRLLQLKTTELVSSDEGYDEDEVKKKLKKDKLIDLYVDVLRSKKLKRSDNKLLEITGFRNVLSVLNSQKAYEKVAAEWATPDNMYSGINTITQNTPKYFETMKTNSNFHTMGPNSNQKQNLFRTKQMNQKIEEIKQNLTPKSILALNGKKSSKVMINTNDIYNQSFDQVKLTKLSTAQRKKDLSPINNHDYFYESPENNSHDNDKDESHLDLLENSQIQSVTNNPPHNILADHSKQNQPLQLRQNTLILPQHEFEYFQGTSFRKQFPDRAQIESIKLRLRKESNHYDLQNQLQSQAYAQNTDISQQRVNQSLRRNEQFMQDQDDDLTEKLMESPRRIELQKGSSRINNNNNFNLSINSINNSLLQREQNKPIKNAKFKLSDKINSRIND